MAYNPVQDGTQAFGIPDSPVTIDAVTYILEDVNITAGSSVAEIRLPNGVPSGRVYIPEVIEGTGTLQKASSSTAIPARGTQFTWRGQQFYLTEVGDQYQQGQYQKIPISFANKINP